MIKQAYDYDADVSHLLRFSSYQRQFAYRVHLFVHGVLN